jgi:ABC-2 type transport system ATP-binding protein
LIICDQLTKNFLTYPKEPGFLGSLKSLYKRPTKVVNAVDSFSFQVNPGEFIGLLGPNGAGKTTIMKMLTGIIVPSSGSIKVMDHEPFSAHSRIDSKVGAQAQGYLASKADLKWKATNC